MRFQFPSLVFPALAAAAITFPPLANAAAQRTFVASYGLSTNTSFDCSITKPCRALSEAIGVVHPSGEVVVLDSAGYGPVTIAKSVTIVAPAGVYAGVSVVINDGITVNAPGATVVLRGVAINGQGGSIGINIAQAARVRIENCVISGMATRGIRHGAPGAEVVVVDTIVRDNGDVGVFLNAADASIVLDRVRIEHNQAHGFYIAPTPGAGSASATISDSVVVHNTQSGVQAEAVDFAATYVQIERSIISHNGGNGFRAFVGAGSGAEIFATLARNSLESNGGVPISGTGISPGRLVAHVVDNALLTKVGPLISVDGSGGRVFVAGNSGASPTGTTMSCDTGAVLHSLGNNTLFGVAATGGCYSISSGG